MIVGIGVDIIEHVRLEQELWRGPWKTGRDIFTAAEIENCADRKNVAGTYAACFAAKEAALKALGTVVPDLSVFREVEVLLGRNGRHEITLHGRTLREAKHLGVRRIWLSIASTKKYSSATVVLEA